MFVCNVYVVHIFMQMLPGSNIWLQAYSKPLYTCFGSELVSRRRTCLSPREGMVRFAIRCFDFPKI